MIAQILSFWKKLSLIEPKAKIGYSKFGFDWNEYEHMTWIVKISLDSIPWKIRWYFKSSD